MAKYYYDTGEQKEGPVTGEELLQLRAEGKISGDTWVRKADSATWRHLSQTDLREEEDAVANPSLWQILRRFCPPSTLIILCCVLIVFCVLMFGALSYLLPVLWPIIPVLVIFWLLSRLTK